MKRSRRKKQGCGPRKPIVMNPTCTRDGISYSDETIYVKVSGKDKSNISICYGMNNTDTKNRKNFLDIFLLIVSFFYLIATLNITAYCFIMIFVSLAIVLIYSSRLRSKYTAAYLVAGFVENYNQLPKQLNFSELKQSPSFEASMKSLAESLLDNVLRFSSAGITTGIATYCCDNFLVTTIVFIITFLIAKKVLGKVVYFLVDPIKEILTRINITKKVEDFDLCLACLAAFAFLAKKEIYNPVAYRNFIKRYSLKVNYPEV